jgi:hypothetical protein
MRCGHEEPSREETSFTARPNLSFSQNSKLDLFSNDTAIIEISGKKIVNLLN